MTATPPSTRPSGTALFRDWLEHEGSKSWDGLDTSPDGSYEKVWASWLQQLAGELPIKGKHNQADAGPAPSSSIATVIKKRNSKTPVKPKHWHEATAIDVQHFLQLRQGQRALHQPDRQISEVTRRRYWRLLERIYDHACEHGWIAHNPARGIEHAERPPSEDGKGHCLPAPLWNALPRHIPAADGYQNARDRAIMLLLYELALAPEEVRALLWRDVQGEDRQPIQGAESPQWLRIDGARAAQQRTLAIPENVAQALADWRRFSHQQRGPLVVDGDHIVFYSRRGGPLSVRMLFHVASQIIQKTHQALPEDSQKTRLLRVGPQVLRNTAVVQWLKNGRPELEVIAQIGLESTKGLRHLQHYL
ncbi:MAG: site-specific integrase [Comamonas sp.]